MDLTIVQQRGKGLLILSRNWNVLQFRLSIQLPYLPLGLYVLQIKFGSKADPKSFCFLCMPIVFITFFIVIKYLYSPMFCFPIPNTVYIYICLGEA